MNAIQHDLFATPLPPGLAYADSFATADEEAALIEHINASDLSHFRFQQWTGRRLTHSYGWHYDFEIGKFEPTEAMPEWLLPFRDRAAGFAGLARDALVQALLTRYDPRAGIGWHRDRPVFEHVVGISLGQPATMRFRRRSGGKFERISMPLAPRSIYHISGEVRHAWEHSITPMDDARWSITFRSLSLLGTIVR